MEILWKLYVDFFVAFYVSEVFKFNGIVLLNYQISFFIFIITYEESGKKSTTYRTPLPPPGPPNRRKILVHHTGLVELWEESVCFVYWD